MSRGLAASATLCLLMSEARNARAQDAQHPTLLAYEAPAGCPAVGDFQRSVQRRSARIHFVDEGTHDRELSIFLHKDGDFTIGELRLIEANGTLRQRSVRFTTCAEAIEGLALIATVSLDPEALLEAPSAPLPTAPTPATPSPPTPSPATPRAIERRPRASASPAPGADVHAGALFDAYFGALPRPALGGAVFLDVGSRSRHTFRPAIRVGFTRVERLGIPEATGRANFALTVGTVSGCPLGLGGQVLIFQPCAWLSGGALSSWGTETTSPISSSHLYGAWGGSGTLLLRLGELVEIVGDAGVGVTLIRQPFTIGNARAPFWTTPMLYLSSGLGLRIALQ